MIIERVTHDSYASQLTRRIIDPLGLRSTCLAPYTCPLSDAAQMPAGYLYIAGVPPSLLGQAMPPLALTWAQGAGGIVTSLADLTTWDRALYQGQLLPPPQQQQLESLVSESTGQPIPQTTIADPVGYGLGVEQATSSLTGTIWEYEGESFGYRVFHLYVPSSGMIIALAVNSATSAGNDELGTDLAGAGVPDPGERRCRPRKLKGRPNTADTGRGRRSAAGIREPDRPPGRCRFGLCLRCGVWVGKCQPAAGATAASPDRRPRRRTGPLIGGLCRLPASEGEVADPDMAYDAGGH